MSYSPPLTASVTPDVISNACYLSTIGEYRATTAAGVPASQAPAANLAYACPIYIPTPKTFKRAFWYAGTTVTGNVDVGLYRMSDLAKLVSTGAVAIGTTVVVNDAALTDQTVLILPGWYYLAISPSATTCNFFGQGASAQPRWYGCATMATAHPLPATLVPAAWTSNILPYFGLTSKTFV